MDILGYTFDADTYCVACTEKAYPGSTDWRSDSYDPTDYTDSEGNELGAIFADSEWDSPEHCAKCHVFLENALTGDGYMYVVAALRDVADGSVEVLREWYARYSANFSEEDWQELAEAWMPYVLPQGLASVTNVDHGALFTFERPTDRDDFTRGRTFGDTWKQYDPFKFLGFTEHGEVNYRG